MNVLWHSRRIDGIAEDDPMPTIVVEANGQKWLFANISRDYGTMWVGKIVDFWISEHDKERPNGDTAIMWEWHPSYSETATLAATFIGLDMVMEETSFTFEQVLTDPASALLEAAL